jgi:hypothetical protein
MSVAEQALSLLDIFPSMQSRSRLENFSSLDLVIGASLPGSQAPLQEAEPAVTENLYSVASRMGRANYEQQAKAEALLNALRQMTAKNAARSIQTSRVLRRS